MTLKKKALGRNIESLLPKWANTLDISDYTYQIETRYHKGLREDFAHITTDEETRSVTIEFNPRALKTIEDVEQTIVHELLHVRMSEICEFVDDIIKDHITNPKTRRMLKRQFGRLEHKVIVSLTKSFCPRES